MNRERLTITLRDDLLARVDQLVDGIRVRNRSHAIEVLLAKALSTGKIKKAFILAGGEGTRMRPFTYEMPKPLIPVHGKPLVQHLIELLRKYEIRDITFSIGYLGDKIKEYFGNGSRFGVNIHYVEEKRPLGTAGPLRLVRDRFTENFFVLNGDVLANIDLVDMLQVHEESKACATIALTPVSDASRYGVARLRGQRILEFVEKPSSNQPRSQLINAGIYVFSPKIFDYLPQKSKAMLETDVFPKLATDGKLYGYPFEGQWFDTSTYEAYEQAIKHWKPII